MKTKSPKEKDHNYVHVPELINSYLEQSDWRVNENSNMNYSFQGLNNYIAGTIQAKYWLDFLYPKEIGDAHSNGDYHIHDLSHLSVYCLGWSLEDLLMKGFTGVTGKISSAPAKHFRTALGHIVNFLYTLQHEAAGAQAFSSFDTYLAPFIRYDKLSYKEVKQAMQEFVFNMNVPTRVGGQTPFTNITMDIFPTGELAEQHAIIGGELMLEKFKDFGPELKMINKAYAEVMMEGDADGRVFSFPIPTYNITKEFNWDDPDFDEIWEMTAKYGIPYFSNFVNSDINPDDARSMCCRLRLDNRELRKRGGGLFGSNPLTGSVGVVTINLPRIGYLATSEEDYFDRLTKIMDLAKESLMIKREFIENQMEKGLYPYSKFYLKSVNERFGEYWKNHFNTIGINGMNESVLNFMDTDLTTPEGIAFAEKVMDFMRDKLGEYQDETDQLFNLEATPAESTAYRLAKKDKELYPEIRTSLEYTNRESIDDLDPYYSNSSQLPVNFTDDVFDALDKQDSLQTKYTGGTVFHMYIGERMNSIESTKLLIKRVTNNYEMPYFSLTPTFSISPKYGYIDGEHEYCPKHDQDLESEGKELTEENRLKCEVYSRVVGYIRPVSQWNNGKKSEWADRVHYENHVSVSA